MHGGAKEESAVLVPKPLKINGSRSVHAELGVTGVTFAEVSSGGTELDCNDGLWRDWKALL